MRYAIAAMLLAAPAYGQGYPLMPPEAGDVLELGEHPTAFAQVYYSNSAGKNSTQGATRHEWGGEWFTIHIKVGDAETITVTPDNPAFMLYPADPVDVPDGADTVILILYPVS